MTCTIYFTCNFKISIGTKIFLIALQDYLYYMSSMDGNEGGGGEQDTGRIGSGRGTGGGSRGEGSMIFKVAGTGKN